MGTRTAGVLRQVVRTADHAGTNDRDLLKEFAAGHQAAFATLVARHAGMVLGVCRRALSHAQDAEDACQATFVVLAKKATAGRWQPSVANWLYATARKVAHNARVAAARRARREGRAAVPEAVPALDAMTGRELLAVLDEELDRLPPRYREPLVLCYLEGLTRDEAAKRLAVPPATLKSQLERGRTKLEAALTKRGCALGVGLLAVTVSSRAGAFPPRFIELIVIASGRPSPAVAALAEGVAVHGSLKKLVLVAAVLAATAAVGFGPGNPLQTTAGQPPEKAMPAKVAVKTEAAAEKSDGTRTIAGTVVDPAGKPVAGAEMIHFPVGGKPAVVGKTDAAGKFSVSVPIKEPGAWLFPRVPGYGPGDFLMPASNTPAEKTFRLVKDVPIRGRVLDTEGKPVAGAAVVVRSLSGYEEADLDRFLAAWVKRDIHDHGSPQPRGSVHWTAPGGGMALDRTLPDGSSVYGAVTDKAGRFEIANVGGERVVHLNVRGPGIADVEVAVLTREKFDLTPYNRLTIQALKDEYAAFLGRHYLLYPPTPEVVAEAEKPVRGVVTDEAGRPVAGVRVHVRSDKMADRDDKTTVTDAAGKYEVRGLRKLAGYRVSVARDVGRGLLGRTITVRDTTGYEPVVVDATLMRGIVLTGRITDGGTGRPIPGYACVGVLFDNEYANKPGFDSPDCYDDAYAKGDGVYRTVVPPGPVIVMVGTRGTGSKSDPTFEERRTDPDYPRYFEKDMSGFRSPGSSTTMIQGQYSKVLILKPDRPEVTFDVTLRRASKFRVRIQDAAGKPLSEVLVTGTAARDWTRPVPSDGGAITVYELDKAKPRLLVFYEPKRSLVGTLTVKGDETEALARLGPAGKVKGRLVDAAGKPFANVRVQLSYFDRVGEEIDRIGREVRQAEGKPIETDANGDFEQAVVIPGLKFVVFATRNGRYLEPPERKRETGFEVRAGGTTDLGKIVLKGE